MLGLGRVARWESGSFKVSIVFTGGCGAGDIGSCFCASGEVEDSGIALEIAPDGGRLASLFADGCTVISSSLSFRFAAIAVTMLVLVGSCVDSLVGVLLGAVLDTPVPGRRTGPFGLKALLFPFNMATIVPQSL